MLPRIELTSPTVTRVITDKMPTTLEVAGRVYDEETGEPYANVTVEIDFNGKLYTTTTDSEGRFSKTVSVPEYGTYYLDVSVPKLTGYYTTISYLRGQFPGNYYWVGLRMYVNGVEVDPDTYPPIYPGDTVKICGKLYDSGNPVAGRTINLGYVVSGIPYLHAVTNSEGYFEFVFESPDWKEYDLCDERARAFYINALECVSNGYPISWEFYATLKCREVEKPNPMFKIDYIEELKRNEKLAWLEYNGQKCWMEHWIEVEAGKAITAKAVIVNQGGKGECQFWVYDATNGEYVKGDVKTLDENEEWNPSVTFTAPNKDTNYELHACYKDPETGEVYISDKAGCDPVKIPVKVNLNCFKKNKYRW